MSAFSNIRIQSIDMMRGATLFLMLFVNDLYEPGVPQWLVHTKAETDGMGLADWVFPGFLFMVGMSVPFAIDARKKSRDASLNILLHILTRTLSLLIIGVLMLNSSLISPELTGVNRFVWTVLMYICVFLIWNAYPKTTTRQKLFNSLRVLGIVGLIILVAVFRSGTPDNPGWLTIGWWGILGLIGWGYLAAAVTYLYAGNKLIPIVAIWMVFLLLNIVSQISLYTVPHWLQRSFGVLLNGSTPFLTLAGVIAALMIRKKSLNAMQSVWILVLLGIGSLTAGWVLRNWFIVSKIKATPSWSMLCTGISFILFALFFFLVDMVRIRTWGKPLELTGKNSLTTYLAPDIIYYLCWGFNIPLFFYKQSGNEWLAVSGSLAWSLAMIGFSILLSKAHIRLKL